MTRRLRVYLAMSALAVLVTGWALVLRPAALGGPVSYIVVRGTSMLPAYATGDLVIVRSSPAYQVGEVVAYRIPDGQLGHGQIVIHRIVGGGPNGFRMRGDNNDAVDPWTPRQSDMVGAAWVSFPGLGRALVLLHQPALLAALAAAIAVLLVLTWSPAPSSRRVATG
jgi:signal peptidase